MHRTLRVATVGAGYFSQFHHDAWSRIAGARLVAVCDHDRAKAQTFAERWLIPNVYTDVRAMLDAERPDLLDIVTPPPTHVGFVREAASRGIAVICQKAFCTSLQEAEEAVAITEQAGTLLVSMRTSGFSPGIRRFERRSRPVISAPVTR